MRTVASSIAFLLIAGTATAATNVWQGAGNASVAGNWSLGVPGAADDILLDATSTANMTWDAGVNGLPTTVASWTQTAAYTGTNTFPIQYDTVPGATFTDFTVAGDVTLNGGAWTHTANSTAQTYRLKATLGGALTVGSAASITALGKGYSTSTGGKNNGCHGGNANNTVGSTYGNPKYPVDIGARYSTSAGGGAILLNVAGPVSINGTVIASGVTANTLEGGAGGSILIQAPSVAGAGTIVANGAMGTKSDYPGNAGSGGRIALLTTDAVGMPTNNVTAYGRATGSTGHGTGAGTIFLRKSGDTHGTLIVANVGQSFSSNGFKPFGKLAVTPVNAGETWTFDAVLTRAYGVLSVPVGSSLILPNGLASVLSLDTTTPVLDGIRYDGGTLDIGSFATHTVSGGWCFQAASPYTISGNLDVLQGASIGLCRLRQNVSESGSYLGCDLTVSGNMTVDSSSFIEARHGGFWDSTTTYHYSTHGGYSGIAAGTPYGSLLNPSLPSGGHAHATDFYMGAGVVKLTVLGNLEMNGAAKSDGVPYSITTDSKQPSPGGSLNLTLGSLSGIGSISAIGGLNNKTTSGGTSGGRIAVRLTGPTATFSGPWLANINAFGRSYSGSSYTRSGGAGTVYLETLADGANGGRIIVRNDNNANNLMLTPIPATGTGADAAAALAGTTLVTEQWGRVKLTNDLKLKAADIGTSSSLDLAGRTLTLKDLTVAGTPVGAGTYSAAELGATQVVDSLGGGQVVIVSGGTMVLIR
jgi:hypothetical protein